jgi:pimeloyl-ACP methyl ester carboxylesterase
MTASQTRRSPGLAAETRAVPEFASFVATAGPLLVAAPRGDGHPVLVLPGFRGDDDSTRPLRWFLRRLGYHVHGWGLGTNVGPTARITDGLTARFADLVERHDEPVSVIGWSLGGVYARAVGRRQPGHVRQVITLGSPLRGTPDAAPAVPVTSIYSRTDAIVPWRASLLADGPRRENVEIRGSHLGLGHNPSALIVVADRLAQPLDGWQPFRAPRWARLWLAS